VSYIQYNSETRRVVVTVYHLDGYSTVRQFGGAKSRSYKDRSKEGVYFRNTEF